MEPTPSSSCDTLVSAMRILARDIESEDGIANSAILEASDRIDELRRCLLELIIAVPAEYLTDVLIIKTKELKL